MLICPAFYDGQTNGIGRVANGFYQSLKCFSIPPFILSANDSVSAPKLEIGKAYGGSYGRMFVEAFGYPFQRPPFIICMHLALSSVARVLAQRYRVPLWVFIHGVEAWKPLKMRDRWGLEGATQLLFNSHFTRRHFYQFNPEFSDSASSVIPLGIGELPEQDFLCYSSSLGSKPDLRILIVGRLSKGERYKGHQVLMKSLGLVQSEFPQARLTIVGDGDGRAELEAIARSYSYAQQIEFTGRVSDSDLSLLYQRSQVFAMPSMGEGFGLVYLEAMAQGLPCLCSNVDAAREVVVHGETGFAVDPTSAEDVAERISQLFRDRPLAQRLGEAGRRRFAEQFTQSQFQTRIQRLIQPYL